MNYLTDITYITHITYKSHITYITHITYIAYLVKILTGYYKKSKERLQKRLAKGIKIFLKKNTKNCQYARERYSNLSEEKKNKKRQYGRK